MALTAGSTDLLKYTTNRTRPDNSGHDSFPSGHVSITAACNTLATRNLQYLEMPDGARTGLRAGFLALSLTTGWSRLEARKHFPSDVLAGMALGHFFGAFIHDAFLGLDSPKTFFFAVEPSKKDIYCRYDAGPFMPRRPVRPLKSPINYLIWCSKPFFGPDLWGSEGDTGEGSGRWRLPARGDAEASNAN